MASGERQFTLMVACFGLRDGCPHFPTALLVERNLRLSVWDLLEQGMLVEGTVSRVVFEAPVGRPRLERTVEIRRESPHVWIDGTRVLVTWHSPNPESCHPYFECPVCSRRCRHVYLRDRIACRRCHHLDWAVRHVGRQTPAVGRVERLRRRLGDCETKPFAPLPTP